MSRRKTLFYSLLGILFSMSIASCEDPNDFSKDLELSFPKGGEFKIVQFTDLHLKMGDIRSDSAYMCIENVVNGEKPDLIMVTGDIIYSEPAKENFQKIMSFLNDFDIPFGIVFGNHDHEFGVSDRYFMDEAMKYDNCVSYNDKYNGIALPGDSNYALPIYSSNEEKVSVAYMIYCFDSHSYSRFKGDGVDGYDFIAREQINWYSDKSKRHAIINDGEPVNSLTFLHIPLPEYEYAIKADSSKVVGDFKEAPCAPKINSGLFAEMKERGDMRAVFAGHDHDNDFTVMWQGILLAYGRFSGGHTEYFNLGINGARVVTIYENSPKLKTWIRLSTGEIKDVMSY